MRKIVNAFCSMSRVNIQLTQKQPEGGRDVLAVPYGPSGNGIVFQRDKSEVFVGGQLSQHRLGKDGVAAVESIAGQVALAVEHYVLAQLAYLSTQQGGGILQRDQLQLQGKVQLFSFFLLFS